MKKVGTQTGDGGETGQLAACRTRTATSRGRLHDETASLERSPYQRDRDRIVHSTAFRRLNHKTQVFVHHEGDHFRSRLTHSLEVAQIARSIARLMRVDEDLAEAIALAHDLGHPPFGHAGERALDAVMADYGGFDHNAQSLRVVTALERKYANFDGLNLTWETLEGIAKHNGPVLTEAGDPAGPYAGQHLPRALRDYNRQHDLELHTWPGIEAQVAAIADDIAYNNHDIDDGFRARSYALDDLARVPLAGRILEEVNRLYPNLEAPRLIYEITRRMIALMIEDVVDEAKRRVAESGANSDSDVRAASDALVGFSPELNGQCEELRFFLLSWVYRNDRVMSVVTAAESIVRDLFTRYMDWDDALPASWQARALGLDEQARAELVCDFIAGMTDRYAVNEHQRLFDRTPELR